MNRVVTAPHAQLLERLRALRVELVELAFTLDSRGRFDAADVAMTTSARVDELCAEPAPGETVAEFRLDTARREDPLRADGPGG
jgi:hypothetical protein